MRARSLTPRQLNFEVPPLIVVSGAELLMRRTASPRNRSVSTPTDEGSEVIQLEDTPFGETDNRQVTTNGIKYSILLDDEKKSMVSECLVERVVQKGASANLVYRCTAVEGDLKLSFKWRSDKVRNNLETTFLIVCQVAEGEELYKVSRWVQFSADKSSFTEDVFEYSAKISVPIYSSIVPKTVSGDQNSSQITVEKSSEYQKAVEVKIIPTYVNYDRIENFEISAETDLDIRHLFRSQETLRLQKEVDSGLFRIINFDDATRSQISFEIVRKSRSDRPGKKEQMLLKFENGLSPMFRYRYIKESFTVIKYSWNAVLVKLLELRPGDNSITYYEEVLKLYEDIIQFFRSTSSGSPKYFPAELREKIDETKEFNYEEKQVLQNMIVKQDVAFHVFRLNTLMRHEVNVNYILNARIELFALTRRLSPILKVELYQDTESVLKDASLIESFYNNFDLEGSMDLDNLRYLVEDFCSTPDCKLLIENYPCCRKLFKLGCKLYRKLQRQADHELQPLSSKDIHVTKPKVTRRAKVIEEEMIKILSNDTISHSNLLVYFSKALELFQLKLKKSKSVSKTLDSMLEKQICATILKVFEDNLYRTGHPWNLILTISKLQHEKTMKQIEGIADNRTVTSFSFFNNITDIVETEYEIVKERLSFGRANHVLTKTTNKILVENVTIPTVDKEKLPKVLQNEILSMYEQKVAESELLLTTVPKRTELYPVLESLESRKFISFIIRLLKTNKLKQALGLILHDYAEVTKDSYWVHAFLMNNENVEIFLELVGKLERIVSGSKPCSEALAAFKTIRV